MLTVDADAKLYLSFWTICNIYNKRAHNQAMEAIRKDSMGAYEWLLDELVKHWARYTFPVHFKCPDNTTNFVESFNVKIEPFRYKSIFTLLEEIRMKFIKTIANRFQVAKSWASHRKRDRTEKRKLYTRSNTLRSSKSKQFGRNSRSHREGNVLEKRRGKDKPRKPKVGVKEEFIGQIDDNTLKKDKDNTSYFFFTNHCYTFFISVENTKNFIILASKSLTLFKSATFFI
ncbi:LOW QUALITY PROTEIN: hypothetical protein Cgig2_028200 [Carnegiea gigantea]|uniref:Uncharacterized protein n=1 Tax=Carnegiea gigantea TaxID=171969 RepID=A0A9Q1JL28_9CARY|nr:LOW QUALITY PROTEIN: hypothetical protein Cgig2_028200 [Carnegiea gigantea]